MRALSESFVVLYGGRAADAHGQLRRRGIQDERAIQGNAAYHILRDPRLNRGQMTFLLNGKSVDALALIVHKSAEQEVGRAWVKKLRTYLLVARTGEEVD